MPRLTCKCGPFGCGGPAPCGNAVTQEDGLCDECRLKRGRVTAAPAAAVYFELTETLRKEMATWFAQAEAIGSAATREVPF